MKKIVIFGGGSGLSQLLKGLKLFPVELTAVVSVCDNGKSTGRLRKDYNIPAVGDITKVLLSMSECDEEVKELMNYRFYKSRSLSNHSIKNLLLTALLDLKGNFNDSIPVLTKLLNIQGTVLPLTEDNVDLAAETIHGKTIVGEEQITNANDKIVCVRYSKEITVNPKVISAVRNADLIIFSSGSLITSVIPHLLNGKLNKEIIKSQAKIMYVCNLFTQPGETDGFAVSDHIKMLEDYLGKNTIDLVIANEQHVSNALIRKYQNEEQKDQVVLDTENLKDMKLRVISDKLYKIEDNYYRHDSLKTAYLIFSYLMEDEK